MWHTKPLFYPASKNKTTNKKYYANVYFYSVFLVVSLYYHYHHCYLLAFTTTATTITLPLTLAQNKTKIHWRNESAKGTKKWFSLLLHKKPERNLWFDFSSQIVSSREKMAKNCYYSIVCRPTTFYGLANWNTHTQQCAVAAAVQRAPFFHNDNDAHKEEEKNG